MSKDIKINKGLDIKLVGAAEQNTSKAVLSNVYAITLNDFVIIILFVGQNIIEFKPDGFSEKNDGKLVLGRTSKKYGLNVIRFVYLLLYLTEY